MQQAAPAMLTDVDGADRKVLQKLKPYLAMMFLQCGFAGMHVVSAATLSDGMSQHVLVVYRNIVATVVIAPFALWFERKGRPRMTPIIFLKITALALLQPVIDQNFYYMGVKTTSASFTSAIENMCPSVTFFIAFLFGVEKLNIRRRPSQAKVIGVLVTVAGALLMILYKGPIIQFVWSKGEGHLPTLADAAAIAKAKDSFRWIKGTLMILVSCVSWSSFLILQSNTLEAYPAKLILTTLICAMGALMNSVIALVVEHGSVTPWIITWDTRLLAPIYSGVVCSGVSYYILGMVMKAKGPVFAGAFSPLSMVISTILGSIVLAEIITLGMMIGAVILVVGLYFILWGKSMDCDQPQSTNGRNEGEAELPISLPSGTLSTSQPSLTIEISKMERQS